MIQIGKYSITCLPNGKFWIEIAEDGEGMECSAEALEAVIALFYAKNF